jgi:osmotically-inducible protein OsmY
MDDSKLRQDVLDELDWQPDIPSAQIAVTVDQGVVRLSGYVSTYAEKVAAEQAVKRIIGVRGGESRRRNRRCGRGNR